MTVELVKFAKISCYATGKDEARFIYKEIFEEHCYDIPHLSEAPFIIETFDILRRNLALHRLSDNVKALPFGLGSKASTEKLTQAGVNRIDLLKIDVEGAELEVLRGLDDGDCALIRNIVLETWEPSGVRVEIERLLQSKGFTITREGASFAPKEFYMIRAYRDDSHVPNETPFD